MYVLLNSERNIQAKYKSGVYLEGSDMFSCGHQKVACVESKLDRLKGGNMRQVIKTVYEESETRHHIDFACMLKLTSLVSRWLLIMTCVF